MSDEPLPRDNDAHDEAEEAGPLVLKAPEAAKLLKVSERTLWTWTNSGVVPHLKERHVILYPIDALRDWLRRRADASLRPGCRARKQPAT